MSQHCKQLPIIRWISQQIEPGIIWRQASHPRWTLLYFSSFHRDRYPITMSIRLACDREAVSMVEIHLHSIQKTFWMTAVSSYRLRQNHHCILSHYMLPGNEVTVTLVYCRRILVRSHLLSAWPVHHWSTELAIKCTCLTQESFLDHFRQLY